MDADSLLLSLELASGSGQGLSPDLRASLLTSLTLVKRDYRYDRVLFWGRILGLFADYYIAQGLSEDQLAPRKTLYRWRWLPGGPRPILKGRPLGGCEGWEHGRNGKGRGLRGPGRGWTGSEEEGMGKGRRGGAGDPRTEGSPRGLESG